MGHSSIQVTYDRYGHLMPDWQDQLSGKLDALYRDSKGVDGPKVAGLAQ
jgi:hypothetical protein